MKWDEGFIGGVHDEKNIKGFYDDFTFLSNFYPCPVMWKGLKFKSSEAAYQAAKSLDPLEWVRFTKMGAGESKKEGRKLTIRPDWDKVKLEIMHTICLHKFMENPELGKLLLETGDKHLEETNWWGDTYWGVCKGEGQNHLGKVLMEIRTILKHQKQSL